MEIRQPVLNTFNRIGINPYEFTGVPTTATNRFTGESVQTHPLIARCIDWVYETSNAFERGDYSVKIADFDRIRYFVLEKDNNAYMTCLD